jgi:hypothetical protein
MPDNYQTGNRYKVIARIYSLDINIFSLIFSFDADWYYMVMVLFDGFIKNSTFTGQNNITELSEFDSIFILK